MEPQNPMVPEQARFELLDVALRVSSRGQAYANRRLMKAMDSTDTPSAHMVYDRLDVAKVAVLYAKKSTPGAVPICRPKPEGAATFSFGPVLAFFPSLKVTKGMILQLPFHLEKTPKGTRLVLDLKEAQVVPSKRRGRKKEPAT